MKFWEALKELEDGKMIRRRHFTHMLPMKYIDLVKFLTKCIEDEVNSHLSAEWDVFEEPSKTISFLEMKDGLKEGKKFRRKHAKGWWIGVDERFGRHGYIINQITGLVAGFNIDDIEATDWIEVK